MQKSWQDRLIAADRGEIGIELGVYLAGTARVEMITAETLVGGDLVVQEKECKSVGRSVGRLANG